MLVLTAMLVFASVAVVSAPALAAGRADRSFRKGRQAAVWTATAIRSLTYAFGCPKRCIVTS